VSLRSSFIINFILYFSPILIIQMALGWVEHHGRVVVFNDTFNNISVILWQSVLLGGGNRSTRRKPPTCRKSVTNFIT